MAASGPAKHRLEAMLSDGGELAELYAPRFVLTEDRYGPRIAAERSEDGRPVSLTFIGCESARGSVLIERLEDYRGAPHKKVAELLDFGTCEGGIYCVQEEVSARNVASVDRKGWGLRSIIPVVSQVLAPVADAHQRGHAVGAVFPSDISLARKQGRDLLVKVQNFGFGAVLSREPNAWCDAPEFASSGATPAADVYAFGALCAALLSEESLPKSDVAQWWKGGRVPHWRKVPSALIDAVGRMLDEDPEARPVDGTAVMELLIDAVPPALFKLPGTSTRSIPAIRLDEIDRPDVSATHPPPAEATEPPASVLEVAASAPLPARRRSWIPVAAMLGLVLVGGGLLAFVSASESPLSPSAPKVRPAAVAAPSDAAPATVTPDPVPAVAAEPTPAPRAEPPEPSAEPPSAEPGSDPEPQDARARPRKRRRKVQPTSATPPPAPAPAPVAKPKPAKPTKPTGSPLLGRSSDSSSNRSSSDLLPPSGSR